MNTAIEYGRPLTLEDSLASLDRSANHEHDSKMSTIVDDDIQTEDPSVMTEIGTEAP